MKRNTDINNMKVIIAGAGPAGLTMAYKLSKLNIKSMLLEKDKVVGGISKTVNYKGYYFDIGGHRFYTRNNDVNEIWREVLKDDMLKCKRLSRIFYNKKFFYYPLRFFDVLKRLGLMESLLLVGSYIYHRLLPREDTTLDQWISSRFGRRLYLTFFKTYSEKIWGIPCNKLSADWAETRIDKLSLFKAAKNSIFDYLRISSKNNNIKSLITEFDYPKFGPGMMWNEMLKNVQSRAQW